MTCIHNGNAGASKAEKSKKQRSPYHFVGQQIIGSRSDYGFPNFLIFQDCVFCQQNLVIKSLHHFVGDMYNKSRSCPDCVRHYLLIIRDFSSSLLPNPGKRNRITWKYQPCAQSRPDRVLENFVHSKECEDTPKIVSYINRHLQMEGLQTWIIPTNMGET